jgi:glycosyltransferase involved in cell wall biosynthesis
MVFRMSKEKLSIIVPVFNEEKTIKELLTKVLAVKLPIKKEIIVVNDGSTDKSPEIIKSLEKKNREITVLEKKNGGKGSAIRIGLQIAKGTIITIQDADLEYEPREIQKIIRPILDGNAEVVFGSRFKGKILGRQLWTHYFGNKILSLATAILFFHNISDMETCYKIFRREVIKGIKLNANGFDFEPELTAKILKKGFRILEAPISYKARTFKEGKKITIKDGLIALKTLIKYRFFD